MHFTDEFIAAVAAAKQAEMSTLNHVHVLALVSKNDEGIPMSALAEKVGVSAAGMTQITDSLAKLELVERAPYPQDRRMFKICITTKGLEALALMLP